jgi:hypothetical protein
VRLYPVRFLNTSLLPFTAAARALVAEGAALGRFSACLLNGRKLKAFLRFSPTTITDFSSKFSAILARDRFLDEDNTVNWGNHL